MPNWLRNAKLALAICLAAGLPAVAQPWPAKPIRIISAFGGGGEVVVRMVAEKMAASLGTPVIVDPRTAAAGLVAATAVARSAPDGYTLLAGSSNTHIYRPLMSKVMPYDPVKDFAPISMLTEPNIVIAVNSSLGITDMRGFIAYARKNGNVFIGTSGQGGTSHAMLLNLQHFSDFPFTHVAYKEDVAPVMDTMTGQIQAVVAPGSTIGRQLASGKLRVIGKFNAGPPGAFEGVKLVADQVPGFQGLSVFAGIFAPAGTPRDVVMQLNSAIVQALEDPAIGEKVLSFGSTPWPSTPEKVAEVVRTELPRVEALLRKAGVEPE